MIGIAPEEYYISYKIQGQPDLTPKKTYKGISFRSE